MNDLITKIQSELPGFSKGQKQIARFILEHYDKAAFMTASRLGVTVGVVKARSCALRPSLAMTAIRTCSVPCRR